MYTESVDSSGELLASSLQSSHDIACQWWECSCPQTFESFPDQASTELRADFLGRLVNVSRSLLEVSLVKPTDTFVVTLPTALGQLPTAERLLGRDASIQLSFSVAGAVLSAICQALSSGSCDTSNTAMVSFPTASIFISGSSEEAAVHRDLINLQAKLIEYLCVHLGMQVSEEAVSSIVRVCILLALFGWSKAPSDLPTDLAPSSNSSSSKTQEQPSVLASMDGKLCCGICGRWVDLLYFCCDSSISSVSAGSNISRVFDPLSQHKSYCPWIATSGNELSCGWQVCVQQLLSTAGQSNEQSRKRVRLSSGNDETYVSTNEDVNTSIEPADVYQRIKAVLDIASSTTLSRK